MKKARRSCAMLGCDHTLGLRNKTGYCANHWRVMNFAQKRIAQGTPVATPAEALLTTEDVARLWKVSPRTVRRLVHSGQIPATRVGRVLRFRPSQLNQALDTLRLAPDESPPEPPP